MKTELRSILISCLLLITIGCNEDTFIPKPKAYPRIEFPSKEYVKYEGDNCPFTFNYPSYGEISVDSSFLESAPESPCWLNVVMKDLKAQIYLSYKEINKEQDLAMLIEDAHFMTSKHAIKAEYIDEIRIVNPQGVGGLIYEVGGNAASSIQFFLTDSIEHFIRGSVYFRSVPNVDSLQPAVDFVKEDVDELIRTFEWVDVL